MILSKHPTSARFITLCLFCAILFQTGCMAASAIKGKQGLDVSGIKAGMRQAEVERILGPATREWATSSGTWYRVYVYDGGAPPSLGDAAAHIFMDIATACIWELAWAISPDFIPSVRISEKIALAYDGQDILVGVFDHFSDFDMLPPDGRAP
jgi:hypothetical protein